MRLYVQEWMFAVWSWKWVLPPGVGVQEQRQPHRGGQVGPLNLLLSAPDRGHASTVARSFTVAANQSRTVSSSTTGYIVNTVALLRQASAIASALGVTTLSNDAARRSQ